jgi:pimeloyl-ACP methyl ester carboxylesterase
VGQIPRHGLNRTSRGALHVERGTSKGRWAHGWVAMGSCIPRLRWLNALALCAMAPAECLQEVGTRSHGWVRSRDPNSLVSSKVAAPTKLPASLTRLVDRFDPSAFDLESGRVSVELEVAGRGRFTVFFDGETASLASPSNDGEPDAVLTADESTWNKLSREVAHGMRAFQEGRLTIRKNLHLGIGFLAATSGSAGPARLEVTAIATSAGTVSALQAGAGDPVLMLHGLGTTKASLLPILAHLANRYRVIAIDLPGFGDSAKPLAAPYNAQFFAEATIGVLNALAIDRAHLVGHSMGGRAALETALTNPQRVGSLILIAPSLAWRRRRQWAPYLRLLRPELGLIQITPRRAVETVLHKVGISAQNGWAQAGIDEFLRLYMSARGRAAFYAAARQIYLEEPDGQSGFWPRLQELDKKTLFVWGTQDRVVPAAFSKHVAAHLATSEHIELASGHVPQLECPSELNNAIADFLQRNG